MEKNAGNLFSFHDGSDRYSEDQPGIVPTNSCGENEQADVTQPVSWHMGSINAKPESH